MALVVEDGTGVVNADSYASLATVDAFQAARGGTAWAAASAPNREIAIRRATDYLDLYHISGEQLSSTQSLSWPFESPLTDSWPRDLSILSKAVCLLAPIALQAGDLVARVPDEAQVLSKTDRVGDLSESRTYADVTDSVTLLGGYDVSFISALLRGFGTRGGLVIGERLRG